MSTKWSLEADYLQACNCEYGCPCEFEAPPSHGNCDGVGIWRINRGSYGDTKLDGLCLGFVAHWPKAIHLGGGTGGFVIDERADAAQREALLKIASGEAGGMPFEIIKMTFAKILPPIYAPAQFKADGINSSANFGTAVTIACESIKNPVNGQPESIRLEHATGFLFKSADVVSGRECRGDLGELKFSYPNKAGFISKVNYSN
jgi:hypothetical protein